MTKETDLFRQILVAIECHDAPSMASCFAAGIDPNGMWNEAPLLDELTSEYTRSPRFSACVQAFADAGLRYPDQLLLQLLLDDAHALKGSIQKQPAILHERRTMRCAYTPLRQASLLHIAAEFNRFHCAEVLIENGADVNAVAGTDQLGFGAQTPLFHCVNQNNHASAQVMELLLENGADPLHSVKGLVWGEGYEWETFIPSVNAISYAMMGLLPQMHRHEQTISQVICRLMDVAYGITYQPQNVPNAYLKK